MNIQFWDAIRFEVDHRDEDGQFILTGSAIPVEANEVHHTGTGRYGWFTMRPMSLWESGDSTGEISLSDLFLAPDKIGAVNKLTLPMLAFIVCRGGWPKALLKKTEIPHFHLHKIFYSGTIIKTMFLFIFLVILHLFQYFLEDFFVPLGRVTLFVQKVCKLAG